MEELAAKGHVRACQLGVAAWKGQCTLPCRPLLNLPLKSMPPSFAPEADLIDPVGVHDPEGSALAAHALLSHGAQVAGGLQLRDTLVGGLSAHHTLRVRVSRG